MTISRRQFLRVTAGVAAAAIAAPLVPSPVLRITDGLKLYPAQVLKPAIDVNVSMMQIQKMMMRMCKHLDVELPSSELVLPQKVD